jgi:hypothetical protein
VHHSNLPPFKKTSSILSRVCGDINNGITFGNIDDSYARYRERWIRDCAGMTVFVVLLKFEGW